MSTYRAYMYLLSQEMSFIVVYFLKKQKEKKKNFVRFIPKIHMHERESTNINILISR